MSKKWDTNAKDNKCTKDDKLKKKHCKSKKTTGKAWECSVGYYRECERKECAKAA